MSLPAPYPDDMVHGGVGNDPDSPATGWEEVEPGRWQRRDEWGNLWSRLEGHSKGEVTRGAVEDWDMLEGLTLPDYNLPERYAGARRNFQDSPDRFKIGHIPGFPFNIARKMRRLGQFLMDVMLEAEKVERLLAMVEEQLHHAIRHLAAARADAVMFPEDWGTQDRLLVKPATWRRLFKPGFVRLCEAAHDRGMFVLMHSCGRISEVMDDMIEAGIDCFQFDQPRLYGIEWLAERFGGRATFWCPVDIQTTLQSGDLRKIEADARLMVERLGGAGGGFIAGYYGGNEAIGLGPEVQDAACRAFVKYGAPALWEELKDQLAATPGQG